MFPPNGGISNYFAPNTIVDGHLIDHTRHLQYTFGQYVQALQENTPTNTTRERTIGCIFLRTLVSDHIVHELLNLNTGKIITRRKLTPIPATNEVITRVETLAKRDGMKPELVIKTRKGIVNHLIAGVDGTQDTNDTNTNHLGDEYEVVDDDESNTTSGEYKEESEDENEDKVNSLIDDIMDEVIPQVGPHQLENGNQQLDNQNDNQHNPNNPQIDPDNENNNNLQLRDAVEMNDDQPQPNDQQHNINEINQNHQPDEPQIVPEDESSVEGRYPRRERRPFVDPYYQNNCNIEFAGVQRASNIIPYTKDAAHVCGVIIGKLTAAYSHAETYSIKRGIKKFGDKAIKSVEKEVGQIHERGGFEPVHFESLSQQEKKIIDSLIFLVEKRDGSIKSRLCANGSKQRNWLTKEDSSSPMVTMESILLQAVIDAYECRDVFTADIPNAFIQTEQEGEHVYMKIRGELVDILVGMFPTVYKDFVVHDKIGVKELYVRLKKALYGTLTASLLYYQKWRRDIESIGYKINVYNPCVANKKINGSLHTIR